jgi:xylose isomerase
MIEDERLAGAVDERYSGWDGTEGRAILSGSRSLAEIADRAEAAGHDPQPRSGKQEHLERLVGSYIGRQTR